MPSVNRRAAVLKWFLIGVGAFVAIVIVAAVAQGGGKATPAATPSQTFVSTFNSMAMTKATSHADQAFIVRAGRAFCAAAKHGASADQAKHDLTTVGVTDASLAQTVSLAAQAKGSLCPV